MMVLIFLRSERIVSSLRFSLRTAHKREPSIISQLILNCEIILYYFIAKSTPTK